MYCMTLEEIMLCAKIFAVAMGNKSIAITRVDKDAAVNMLKRMADQSWNWTEQQKEYYKFMVDICKQFM